MPVSFFELFEIGIGPSSSHTAGPMIAARRFLLEAELRAPLQQINELTVELFGSLAITGRRYTTYRAVLFGLLREQPDTIDLERITPHANRSGVAAVCPCSAGARSSSTNALT